MKGTGYFQTDHARPYFGPLLLAFGQLLIAPGPLLTLEHDVTLTKSWSDVTNSLLACYCSAQLCQFKVKSDKLTLVLVFRLSSTSNFAGLGCSGFNFQVQLPSPAESVGQWPGGSTKSTSSRIVRRCSWTDSWLSQLDLTMECPHLTKTESVTGLDIQDLKSKLKDGIDCSGLN